MNPRNILFVLIATLAILGAACSDDSDSLQDAIAGYEGTTTVAEAPTTTAPAPTTQAPTTTQAPATTVPTTTQAPPPNIDPNDGIISDDEWSFMDDVLATEGLDWMVVPENRSNFQGLADVLCPILPRYAGQGEAFVTDIYLDVYLGGDLDSLYTEDEFFYLLGVITGATCSDAMTAVIG